MAETTPELWSIELIDLTDGQSFSESVPYSSSYLTAEWIEETPVVVSSSGSSGIAALPNLTAVDFDLATVNGSSAGLVPAEAVQLIDSSGNPIATPSAPDSDADGFNDCTWATSCATPSS